ncbi:hypothetical protein B0J11DRAFT_100394 [Dendryphion nanum]|uniref:F-box domain-containing protein n=1 Tax=Dendryphion nanum TaxID=256645 RepID=A0A9P9DD45_9PLEO|nr:hypothetical protein B0J11DRAFT_100394 [Dendryphion nanum]
MATTIEALPNELLGSCFSHLSGNKPALNSLRLVSKRFYAASSPFLVPEITLKFTTQSFRDLETLATHPSFSRGIITVILDVGYYDPILADSLRRFSEHNASDMEQEIDILERTTNPYAVHRNKFKKGLHSILIPIPKEWNNVNSDSFDPATATKSQSLLIHAHEEYKRLYAGQQEVLGKDGWAQRMVTALGKFPVLQGIIITDNDRRPRQTIKTSWRDNHKTEEVTYNRCLRSSHWKGSFRTAIDTEPPVHIIPELFHSLAESSIRPRFFDLRVTVPFDLRCMRMSTAQLNAIRTSLSRARKVYIWLQSWARRGSLAENNDRPRDEMMALCNFTSACFSSKHLSDLHLSMDNYPVFYQIPTVSLADIFSFPLPSTKNLARLYLRNVPFKLNELRDFIESSQREGGNELQWLNMYSPWLLTGTWLKASKVLRGFGSMLEHFEFTFPRGAEFGDLRIRNKPSTRKFEDYVTGQTDVNPLEGWEPEEFEE